ncbi:unnamed protein product [Blepharisma stoltei]|uniref:Uncharacterized protein n=1 Tax=Blepharisma stoltei TaxID=1481888 RepID=A0AAU9JBH2_9CILI|nr:unnamed protein product [Blepharisma stoltei]
MAKKSDLKSTIEWIDSYSNKCAQILSRSSYSSRYHSHRNSTASTIEQQISTYRELCSSCPHTAQPSPKSYSARKLSPNSFLQSCCEISIDYIEENEPEINSHKSEIKRLKHKKKSIDEKFDNEISEILRENTTLEGKLQELINKLQFEQFIPIFEEEMNTFELKNQKISSQNIEIINNFDSEDRKIANKKLKAIIKNLAEESKSASELIKNMKSIQRKSDMSVRCLSALANKNAEMENEIENHENKIKNFERQIKELNKKMVEVEDINRNLEEKFKITNENKEKIKKKVWSLREQELVRQDTPRIDASHNGKPTKQGIRILKELQSELKSQKEFKLLELTNLLLPELSKLYSSLHKVNEKQSKLEKTALKLKIPLSKASNKSGSPPSAKPLKSRYPLSNPESPNAKPQKRYTIFSFCKET